MQCDLLADKGLKNRYKRSLVLCALHLQVPRIDGQRYFVARDRCRRDSVREFSAISVFVF
jgi:hypothetical protein